MSILSAVKIAPSTILIKCKAALNTGLLSHSHELFGRLAHLRCSSNIVDGTINVDFIVVECSQKKRRQSVGRRATSSRYSPTIYYLPNKA